jgi:hypothetical protein
VQNAYRVRFAFLLKKNLSYRFIPNIKISENNKYIVNGLRQTETIHFLNLKVNYFNKSTIQIYLLYSIYRIYVYTAKS